jgi:sodium transport system permease protein
MKHFITIFRKEFTDTIRDRRTLFFMIVFPLLVTPLLISAITMIQVKSVKKAQSKTLRVAVVMNGNAEGLSAELAKTQGLKVVDYVPVDSVEAFIARDSLDAGLVVAKDFDSEVDKLHSGTVKLFYKSSQDYDAVGRRMKEMLEKWEKSLVEVRFARLQLDQNIVNPVKLEEHDVAKMQEKMGKTVGGMIPYLFLLMCFTGSMYPAIDLAAGEKERGTMETLLTAPVGRFQILLGKFAVVVLAGLVSASAQVLGIFLAIRNIPEMPPDLLASMAGILAVGSVVLVILLILPVAIFFAAALLSISMYAKSYKEAQAMITPLSIAIILPAMIGMMPGTDLTAVTALIPVLNVCLATKEIIAGTANPLFLAEAYVSLIVLGGLSLLACSKWFMREETIFRGV